MSNQVIVDAIRDLPRGNDFQDRIDWTIRKCQTTGRPFFVVILQLKNIDAFSKRRPRYVLLNLYKELFSAIRKAVHPSQFVGSFQNGFGLVFDSVEVGQVDKIAKTLKAITLKILSEGKYNDVAARWTDIIQQFLLPNKPLILAPMVGWAVYPRDGINSLQVVKRGLHHLIENER